MDKSELERLTNKALAVQESLGHVRQSVSDHVREKAVLDLCDQVGHLADIVADLLTQLNASSGN